MSEPGIIGHERQVGYRKTQRFRVVLQPGNGRMKRVVHVDASAPIAAALEAFHLISDGSVEVVDVTPIREVGQRTLIVTVESRSGESVRLFVEPA